MVTPCNMHINELANVAASNIDSCGGKSVIFNTITVSDGISMEQADEIFSSFQRGNC